MRYIIIVLVAFIVLACDSQFKHPDTSGISVDIHLRPFYRDLFSTSDSSVHSKSERLSSLYGDFYTDICRYELELGSPSDSAFENNFEFFINIPENSEVIATCDSVYNQLNDIDEQLSDAFSCIHYYMPELLTPEVLCHFSKFNRKIVVDSTYISFSIEHYLGSNCRYYSWLEMPQYACATKDASYIVPDLVRAWFYANCPDTTGREDILSAMIYQGKVLYAVKSCLPDLPDNLLFGFDDEHYEWCQNAESDMWACLAEQKLLYSTNPLDRTKIVNDAPFTAFFGPASPGRAALYCAFNIVCSYMRQHPECTIRELFANPNAQQILVESRYRP